MAVQDINPGTGQEAARNEQVAVGTSSVTVCLPRISNPRKNVLLRNTSPNATDIITLNVGLSPAVSKAGIVLNQGDSWGDSSESGYDCVQGTITAICATATGQLSVYER